MRVIFLALVVILLLAGKEHCAFAQETYTVGASCPHNGNNAADWDAIMECSSGTWQRAAINLGTSSAAAQSSCSTAGVIHYNTNLSNIEFCDGSYWRALYVKPLSGVPPSIIQQVYGASRQNPVNVIFGSSPAAGNTLVFVMVGNSACVNPPSGVSTYASGQFDTYESYAVYTRVVQVGDSNTWTFTTCGDYHDIVGFEVSSLNALSVTAGGSSVSGNTSSYSTLSSSGAGAIGFAFFQDDQGITISSVGDSNMSLVHYFGGDGGNHAAGLLKYTGSPALGAGGSSTPSVTWSSSPLYNLCVEFIFS